MTQTRIYGFLMFLTIALIPSTSFAQADAAAKWRFLAEPYLVLPNMTGSIAMRNLPSVDIDAGTSDIFGNLRFGAMLFFEATNDNWSISSDFLYMDLEQRIEPTLEQREGKVSARELVWEIAGLKKVSPWFELGLAGRLVNLNAGIKYQGLVNELTIDESASKTWFDPVFVVRSQGTVNDKWILKFLGDIGGLGIGSDLTWQLQADAGYRFSKLFQTTIGYRYLAMDYDKGEGTETFKYDVDTYGVEIRIGFNF